MLGGGRERIVFRLSLELEKLEATLRYEAQDAMPLAMATMEQARFQVSVHPATLLLNATLGNLRAQDCTLPEVGAQT